MNTDIEKDDKTVSQKQKVLNLLNSHNIDFELIEHEAMYTIAQMVQAGLTDGYCICKNLFLRDYKGHNHYLVVLLKDKKADLKAIEDKIGSSRLSFASEQRLDKYLKLQKGSVSPFGIINNVNHEVTLIIDEDLKNAGKVGFHPNDNTATVIMDYKDFINIINMFGNKIVYFEFL
jgi:Ala-tRNA(Pro) deacylase